MQSEGIINNSEQPKPVLRLNPSRMSLTVFWDTHEPLHRLCEVKGASLEHKVWFFWPNPQLTQETSRLVFIYLSSIPPPHSFIPAFLPASIRPLFHMPDPVFWTPPTTFHVFIKSAAKWAR